MKAHLNPFAPDRVQRLLPFDPRLAETSWQEIESRWKEMGMRGAIVGHKGSGKSTFLKTFAKRLENEQRVIHLFFRGCDRKLGDQEFNQLAQIRDDKKAIVLIDGEGHLAWNQRRLLRKLSNDAAGYLVTRHHRSSLSTLLHLRSSPQIAETLLHQIGPAEEESIRKELPLLLRKNSGNLREVWLSLYDEYACKS